jgi:hypothetical protein
MVPVMITMAAFAIIGAALGLLVRPRAMGVLWPVLLAIAVEGAVQWAIGVMTHQPNREVLVLRLPDLRRRYHRHDRPRRRRDDQHHGRGRAGRAHRPKKAEMMLTADGIQRRVGKNGRYVRAGAWSRNAPSTPRPRAGSTRSWGFRRAPVALASRNARHFRANLVAPGARTPFPEKRCACEIELAQFLITDI